MPSPRVRLPFPNLDTLILDEQQSRYARDIRSGHRLIYGVAGSGKTVTLLARARYAAERQNQRILVLCYNVALAACMRQQAQGWDGVEVFHFDEWAKHLWIVRGGSDESDDGLGERLLHAIENGKARPVKYDSILIDEAQDFSPSWFRCVMATAADPNDGDLLIVSDANQGLYRRRKVSWRSLGIHAQGRTVRMEPGRFDSNYRNTREIIELAARFASAGVDGEDQMELVPPDPAKCARSIRMRPVLFGESNRRDECRRACKIVKGLLGGSWNGHALPFQLLPSEIAILYPLLTAPLNGEFQDFLKDLREIAPVLWVTDKKERGNRKRVVEDGIKVQTIHSAKGLEYRAVIVLWADLLPNEIFDADVHRDRMLMYVAMTRATDFLGMTFSKGSRFITEIDHSGATERARWT